MNYSDDRFFKIWAYTVSHSFLLLRSPMKFPGDDDYSDIYDHNIDIEFSAVAYLDIPHIFQGINIKEVKDNIPERFTNYVTKLGYKIFEIESEIHKFYVIAGSCRIGKNKWLVDSRVSNMRLEYDEILETS